MEVASWQTATRDDGKVALELFETHGCDRVHAIDKAAFFDELFEYLRQIGAWPLLEELDPEDRKRFNIPYLRFVLLTLMRCVGGVQSMLATHDVLLTDEALMALVGFNAIQVQHGTTERGVSRRKKSVGIRGAVSYEVVADNIVKLGPAKLEKMFNGLITCLAKQNVFPKSIDCVLDATDDEATPKYKTDDGGEVPKVSREKRPDVRFNRHAQKTKVTAWGWKIWVVWEPTSKVPLAIRLGGINVADNQHAYDVLLQAKKNVAGYATIRSVALDRGFLDGKLLWRIDQDDIYIYIPAKSNLNITTDAREIARRAAAEAGRFLGEDRLNAKTPVAEWDVAALLKLMWESWNDVIRAACVDAADSDLAVLLAVEHAAEVAADEGLAVVLERLEDRPLAQLRNSTRMRTEARLLPRLPLLVVFPAHDLVQRFELARAFS